MLSPGCNVTLTLFNMTFVAELVNHVHYQGKIVFSHSMLFFENLLMVSFTMRMVSGINLSDLT